MIHSRAIYCSLKVLVSSFLLVSGYLALDAQEALLSSGGDATGAGGAAAYSVGQIAYSHYNADLGQVTQGVQQSYLVIMVGSSGPLPDISVSMYPNPVKAGTTILWEDSSIGIGTGTFSFTLCDIYGKLLAREKITGQLTNVSFEDFPEGVYVLQVFNTNILIKTFKVIKTN